MKQLDGLRAFAVVSTMVTHFTYSKEGWLGVVAWGQMGVRLFFVLSGFLITGILLRSREALDCPGALRIFYWRRFLRIFPLYYATLALTAIANIRPVRQTFWWHATYLSNFYEVIYRPSESPISHFWSLSVEEQFYLMWPCLMLFLPRAYLLRVIIGTVCLGPVARLGLMLWHVQSGDVLLFSCLDTLGMGALLAYFGERAFSTPDAERQFRKLTLWVGVPAFGMFALGYAAHLQAEAFQVLSDLALALAFTWVVGGAARAFRGPVGALLQAKPITYLGTISYGVYVLHPFMAVVLVYMLRWTHLAMDDSSFLWFMTLSTMSVTVAALSWHYLERPMNGLKRYFEYPQAGTSRELKETGAV